MNTILLSITLVLMSFAAQAERGNWFPFGKSGANTVYMKKSKCEQAEGQKCYDTTQKDIRKMKIGYLQPVIDRTTDCDDAANCAQKLTDGYHRCSKGNVTFDAKSNWPSLDWVSAGRNESDWFLWCQIEDLILDQAKEAAIDQADAIDRVQKEAVQIGRSRIIFGQSIIAMVQGQFASKTMTSDDREAALDKFQKTINALQVGSLEAARKRLGRINPDSNIRQEEIDGIIAKIDAFLSQ